jgi:hypothetical protein
MSGEEYASTMAVWMIALLMPVALIGITIAASHARAGSGSRKLKFYAIALAIGVVALLAIVYMSERETWPGGWVPALASTAVSLLALYLWERRFGGKTEPHIPPA